MQRKSDQRLTALGEVISGSERERASLNAVHEAETKEAPEGPINRLLTESKSPANLIGAHPGVARGNLLVEKQHHFECSPMVRDLSDQRKRADQQGAWIDSIRLGNPIRRRHCLKGQGKTPRASSLSSGAAENRPLRRLNR